MIVGPDGEKAWIERATFVAACETLTIACKEGAIGRVEHAIAWSALIVLCIKRVIARDVRLIEPIEERTRSDQGFTRSDLGITPQTRRACRAAVSLALRKANHRQSFPVMQ